MRFLLVTLSTLVGFIFTMGGPWQGSAPESRSTTAGTVVIARENRNPAMDSDWHDGYWKRALTVQAATQDTKKATKTTKPTKKTKSPQKYRP